MRIYLWENYCGVEKLGAIARLKCIPTLDLELPILIPFVRYCLDGLPGLICDLCK
jgi:hypothetical protein